jgi:hypothetical protein
MAGAIPPILIEIKADVESLKKGMAQAEASLSKINQSVERSASGLTNFATKVKQVGATLGVAFAGSQVLNFLKASVADATAAGVAQDRLATLLRNTNGATEEQITALVAQAEAIEKVGVTTKEQVMVAQSQLATFDLAGSTIAKLTPAIVDYVQAEKMGAATSDDFRQMTNGLAQALNGNFASLTKTGFVLDEATKKTISSGTESERAAAIVKVLNTTYRDFNKTLRERDPMRAAILDLQKLRGDIGEALMPVVRGLGRFIGDVLIPALRQFASFVKTNADAIKAFAIVLAVGYASMKAYRGIIVLTTAAKKAYAVATVVMRGGQLASIASTNTLAASMLRLNAIMRANPIGIVITVVALLAAGIVTLWKRSETFRNVVINVAKVALQAFASIIPMIARVGESLAKIATGPMRLVLLGLAKMGNKGAQQALDTLNKGLNSISDMGEKAAKKATELSKKLDDLAKKAKTTGKDVADAVTDPFAGDTRGNKKVVSDKDKAKLKAFTDKLNAQNEKLRDYEAKALDITTEYNREVAKRQARYADDYAKLVKDRDNKIVDTVKKAQEAELKARQTFAETKLKLERDNQNAITKANKEAADKRQSIIQQSIDRLRDVFRSASALDIGKAFSDLLGGDRPQDATVGNIVQKLKDKLAGSKALQAGAEGLKEKGFSQTFIEQVVGQGTEVGAQLARQINEATPETISELQTLFAQVEETSNHGIDALATSMNTGLTLATEELTKAYEQVTTDLNATLAELAIEFSTQMAEAQKELTQNLAEIQKDLTDTLAEIQADFTESVAELQKDLAADLAEMQYDFNKSMTAIRSDIDKTISKIMELMALIGSAGTVTSGGGSGSSNIIKSGITDSTTNAYQRFRDKERADEATYNITNNISTNVSASEIADMTIRAIKYGQTISVGAYDK